MSVYGRSSFMAHETTSRFLIDGLAFCLLEVARLLLVRATLVAI